MTRAMVIGEPDAVEVADVALGLTRWGPERSEVERIAHVLGWLRRAVEAASAATTDEARTDALRTGLVWVRASDPLVEQSRKVSGGERE